MPGVVRVLTGEDLESRRRRRPALRLAGHRQERHGDQGAGASGAGARQGALRRRRGGVRDRRNAGAGARRRRGDRGRLRGAAGRGRRARCAQARRAGGVRRHPGQHLLDWEFGDRHATDAAFKKAAHVARISLVNNRLVGNPMEPRAAIGEYDRARGHYTMWTTSQFPHIVKLLMGNFVLNIPQHKLRVVSPDVGGGFGVKQFHYAEEAVVTWASAQGRTAGEMGVRAQRGLHLRRPRPRPRDRSRAGAGRDRQVPRTARDHHRQHGRLSVDVRPEHPDQPLRTCCWPASTPRPRSIAR